jgi:hypothetical protein
VHQAELQMAEALATELRREVGRPQTSLLHLLLEREGVRMNWKNATSLSAWNEPVSV